MIPSARSFTLRVDHPMQSTVYLKLRQEKMPGCIVGFNVRPNSTGYVVGWADTSESVHYGFELSDTYEPSFDPE